jgi:hypothetical protein
MSKTLAISDTGGLTMSKQKSVRWPREDEIRWVEWELLRARHGADEDKSLSAIADRPLDLEVWLAKAKENKSWKEIGELYFARARTKREARRSEARRAYERVELYLKKPNAPEFQDHSLKRLILETFGVSAQDFRIFILKGHLPRPKKKQRN